MHLDESAARDRLSLFAIEATALVDVVPRLASRLRREIGVPTRRNHQLKKSVALAANHAPFPFLPSDNADPKLGQS